MIFQRIRAWIVLIKQWSSVECANLWARDASTDCLLYLGMLLISQAATNKIDYGEISDGWNKRVMGQSTLLGEILL